MFSADFMRGCRLSQSRVPSSTYSLILLLTLFLLGFNSSINKGIKIPSLGWSYSAEGPLGLLDSSLQKSDSKRYENKPKNPIGCEFAESSFALADGNPLPFLMANSLPSLVSSPSLSLGYRYLIAAISRLQPGYLLAIANLSPPIPGYRLCITIFWSAATITRLRLPQLYRQRTYAPSETPTATPSDTTFFSATANRFFLASRTPIAMKFWLQLRFDILDHSKRYFLCLRSKSFFSL